MWKCHFPAEPVPNWHLYPAMPVSHLTGFTVEVLKLYSTFSCLVSISYFDTQQNPKGKQNYNLAACKLMKPFWENQSRRERDMIDCSGLCERFTKHYLKKHFFFFFLRKHRVHFQAVVFKSTRADPHMASEDITVSLSPHSFTILKTAFYFQCMGLFSQLSLFLQVSVLFEAKGSAD